MEKQSRPDPASGREFRPGNAFGTAFIVLDPGGTGNRRQSGQGSGSRAMFQDQPVKGDRADPAGTNETKNIETFLLRTGWGGVCGVRKLTVRHVTSPHSQIRHWRHLVNES